MKAEVLFERVWANVAHGKFSRINEIDYHVDDVIWLRELTRETIRELIDLLGEDRVHVVSTPSFLSYGGSGFCAFGADDSSEATCVKSFKVLLHQRDVSIDAWHLARQIKYQAELFHDDDKLAIHSVALPGDCVDGRIVKHRLMCRFATFKGDLEVVDQFKNGPGFLGVEQMSSFFEGTDPIVDEE